MLFEVEFQHNGLYLNIKFDRPDLTRDVVGSVESLGYQYGHSDALKGERVLVDFSSPNTAKTMHVGHLRGTIIGQVLVIC